MTTLQKEDERRRMRSVRTLAHHTQILTTNFHTIQWLAIVERPAAALVQTTVVVARIVHARTAV